MPCIACYLYFFRCYFNSPVDHELGGDRQYLDDQFPYPAEEGKRSPTSLIPVFQSILPACDSNIFCCSYSCMWYLPTIPFHCSYHDYVGLLRIARAVLVVYAQLLFIYGRGIIPGGKYLIPEILGDEMVQQMMTMRT